MDLRTLAFGALLAAALPAAHGQPSSGTLSCSGTLGASSGGDWGSQSIEFTLAYAPGAVSPLKSSIEALNAPLRIELDEQFLKASEAQPRLAGPDGNALRIAQLHVSRQTGRFVLQAQMLRDSSDALLGTAQWEGSCNPASERDRRF